VRQLLDKGYEVVIFDNISTGHVGSVDTRAAFVQGDLSSASDLDHVFGTYPIEAVMHFAASSLVGESVSNPLKYYKNNVAATLTLLEKMLEYGVDKFIFSSTAATYGIPETNLIDESNP